MVKIGYVYKQLTPLDFRVLESIERFIGRYEYVPLEQIEKASKIPETKLNLILFKLHRLKLVKKISVSGMKAFRLTYLGLDMIALRNLVNRNVIDAIGDRIGVGKESELYKALTGGVEVVVKFLRIGRSSFRRTRITRSWGEDPKYTWFHQSKIAAEREYKALRELYSVKSYVPYPVGYNRHVVVIEYIDGVELYKRPQLENPLEVLKNILFTLRKAYLEIGIVHGDLSEYNIIVKRDGEIPYVIDWPQYVYRDEPNADALLKRDVEYIVRFFHKVYRVDVDIGKAIQYIRGEYGEI